MRDPCKWFEQEAIFLRTWWFHHKYLKKCGNGYEFCRTELLSNQLQMIVIVRWLKGEVRDIFWEVMPLCFSGSKFTQVYENKR